MGSVVTTMKLFDYNEGNRRFEVYVKSNITDTALD